MPGPQTGKATETTQVRAFALMPVPGYTSEQLGADLAELLRRYLTAPNVARVK